jgi:alpha-ketoglutarate-dependent taurine dioxygenase
MDDDVEASEALARFERIVDQKIGGVALQPGDIIFLDNFKVVHGRKPFKAYFNGKDRWLKRLNITRDLRKSRDSRIKPENRIIF